MEKQEKVFGELKGKFTKEPVLVAPDLDKKMRMEVDTLDYAMGGMLSMECEDGKMETSSISLKISQRDREKL